MRLWSAFAVFAVSVGLLAAAPTAASRALPTAPSDLPTYTCATDGPVPLIYPPVVHGVKCAASNGAKPTGTTSGALRIIITRSTGTGEPRIWGCTSTTVYDRDNTGKSVVGTNCFPEP
ncbi:hypothetical protein LO762_06150 [Actinocorallia sp. API 0066]|uniref:hypothetical protein n=1 Tax=Actinocorallia sp. API 0066 TaxID=2896846 RepID=UPI001E546E34|nr:hypothetical protein [Actinocorallia sp. API 0066]MCD0448778.1 hypothetical protein [Actinocorallia sp. API 0066]